MSNRALYMIEAVGPFFELQITCTEAKTAANLRRLKRIHDSNIKKGIAEMKEQLKVRRWTSRGYRYTKPRVTANDVFPGLKPLQVKVIRLEAATA